MSIHNGVYIISKDEYNLTTLQTSEEGFPVCTLSPTGNPGEQEWQVENLSNGNVTIKNLKNGNYIGYEGDAEFMKPVVGTKNAVEWRLEQAALPFHFHVVVPGGPIDGKELAFDMSLLMIYPPRTALMQLDNANQKQAWKFQFME